MLSQPEAVEKILLRYTMPSANMFETNMFLITSIAQADYVLGPEVFDLNRDEARLARCVANRSPDPTK